MSLSIEMTLRGVLAAGKWRNEAGLRTMSDEDCRNTLIVELGGHSKRGPEDSPQRFNNDELVGKGAIVVFLSQAMGYNRDKLKTMSDLEQRNAVIEYHSERTGISVGDLQGLTNQQLVRLALDVMSLSIEMTLRGVLAAGKWRSEADLRTMSDEDCRNTLIVELGGHSKRGPEDSPQRFNNDELVGKGAIVVFLSQAMGYNRDKLKTMSDLEQRNAIITHNNQRTGIPVGDLQGLTNQQLVRLALVE